MDPFTPVDFLDLLNLGAGARVALAVEHGRLVVEPRARPHYTLDELLAQCDATVDAGAEDREWLSGAPVGEELI